MRRPLLACGTRVPDPSSSHGATERLGWTPTRATTLERWGDQPGGVALLERGGRMVFFGAASGDWAGISDAAAAERAVTLVRSGRPSPEETRELTQSALAAAGAGRLRPLIGQRFALERAADAHAAKEARTTLGKTLLTVAA